MDPAPRPKNCANCMKTLDGIEYILCAECENLHMCTFCFRHGAEGGSHKKNHKYRVMGGLSSAEHNIPTIFDSGPNSWNAEEELRLLDAVEIYGVGNWVGISNKVGGKRTPEDCQQHYEYYYVHGTLGQLVMAPLRGTCHVTDHSQPPQFKEEDDNEKSKPFPKAPTSLGSASPPHGNVAVPRPHHHHLAPLVGGLGLTSVGETVPHTPNDVLMAMLEPDEEQLLGYMPKRDDFEREYDNDAESILCRLHPSFEKDDLEDSLKVTLVGIYTHRLRERQRRKEIAKEHDLITQIMAHIMQRRRPSMLQLAADADQTQPPNGMSTEDGDTSTPGVLNGPKVATASSSSPRKTCRGRPTSNFRPRPRNSSWYASLNFAPSSTRRSASCRGRAALLMLSSPKKKLLNGQEPTVTTLLESASGPVDNAENGFLGMQEENQAWLEENARLHNTLYIDDKLKPFLRYMKREEAVQFLEDLRREEILRVQINDLIDMRKRGKTKLAGIKLRIPRLSEVYSSAQKCTVSPFKPGEATVPGQEVKPSRNGSSVRRGSTFTQKRRRRRATGSYPFSLSSIYRRRPVTGKKLSVAGMGDQTMSTPSKAETSTDALLNESVNSPDSHTITQATRVQCKIPHISLSPSSKLRTSPGAETRSGGKNLMKQRLRHSSVRRSLL